MSNVQPKRPRLNVEQENTLRDKFDLDVLEARLRNEKSSEYFLDKCGSEAGDTCEVPC